MLHLGRPGRGQGAEGAQAWHCSKGAKSCARNVKTASAASVLPLLYFATQTNLPPQNHVALPVVPIALLLFLLLPPPEGSFHACVVRGIGSVLCFSIPPNQGFHEKP